MLQTALSYSFLALAILLGFGITRMGHRLFIDKHRYGGSELKVGKIELGRGAPGNLFALLGTTIIWFALAHIPDGLGPVIAANDGESIASPGSVNGKEDDVLAPRFGDHTSAFERVRARSTELVFDEEFVDALEPAQARHGETATAKVRRHRGQAGAASHEDKQETGAVELVHSADLNEFEGLAELVEPDTSSSLDVDISAPRKPATWCDGSPDDAKYRNKLGRCELKRELVDVFKPMVSSCALVTGETGGEITARFSIRGSTGAVAKTSIQLSDAANSKFSQCVRQSLLRLSFPIFGAPLQGVNYTVRL